MNNEKSEPTREWDEVFPHSDKTDHERIIFHNRYSITLAADLYRPRGARGPLAAVAVSSSFGAAKEQFNGPYAQIMVERGFLTFAFDSSYTGKSSGAPRYTASPDISTKNFSAAVDHLNCRENIDPERIGVTGICGWDGMAINVVAPDSRIRAAIAFTMYDMSRTVAKGYFDGQNSAAARDSVRARFATQCTADYRSGSYVRAGGVADSLSEGVPTFVRDYHDHYETPHGYHLCSLNSNEGWSVMGTTSFLDQPLLAYAGEIRTPVLVVHGEGAHSRYMGEGAFAQLTGENKELLIVPGANHTDLYDGGGRGAIPFDRITEFFRASLVWTRGSAITSWPPSWNRVSALSQPGCRPGWYEPELAGVPRGRGIPGKCG